jgi:hypothetical protein
MNDDDQAYDDQAYDDQAYDDGACDDSACDDRADEKETPVSRERLPSALYETAGLERNSMCTPAHITFISD